ncbi:MAG: hypothetical protein ISQ07_08610 [Pirellulales bacterium]|jgi:hypothetical protein|nr:hypothetical protein [Pirellulales bacterium]
MIDQTISLEQRMPAAMLVPMSGLWVGSVADAEMALALQWAGEQLALQQVACCEEALQQTAGADGPQTPAAVSEPAAPPSLILLPMSWSGEVTRQMLIRLARCWPLAVLVVVVGSGVDGWRRRGPSLPGAVPVPWYELPGRLQMWSEQRTAGRVGGLGTPVTSRREDRLLARVADFLRWRKPVLQTAVAAESRLLCEGLELLAVAAGTRVMSRTIGKPSPNVEGDLLLWDAGDVGVEEINHVRTLHHTHPLRPILLLESFPRGHTAEAVRDAGGSHLLGRLIEADLLAATMQWCLQPRLG